MIYKILETDHLLSLPADVICDTDVNFEMMRCDGLDHLVVESIRIPDDNEPGDMNIYVKLASESEYQGKPITDLTLVPVQSKDYRVKMEVYVTIRVADGLDVSDVINDIGYEFTTDVEGAEIVDAEIEDFDFRETNEDGSVTEPW